MIWAANWKMNLSPQEGIDFLQNFVENQSTEVQKHTWFFPQNYSIGAIYKILNKTPIQWGAQNISDKQNGAFTGENSASTLKDLGATSCLIGHSERRSLFHEDNELLSSKIAYAQSLDLCPLYCIGESLEDRESNQIEKVLNEQLKIGLSKLDTNKSFAIAYEPVWAIGTGQVASLEQVEEAHAFIRQKMKEIYSEDIAHKCPILYGGSVKPENAKSLASGKNVDGFLIGGASLKIEDFCQIIEQSK